MAQAEFLKKRAEEFLENGRENINHQRYNLAAFNLEQACQLYLKYYLFLRLADFPKTHSIRELLSDLGRVYDKTAEVEMFKQEKINEVADLEEAYLSSRYLPAEFDRLRVEQMERFVAWLVDFLASL